MVITVGGGLGDALMAYAKIISSHAPFYPTTKANIKVVHTTNIRGKGRFGDSIKKFYNSQGILCDMVYLESGMTDKWRAANEDKFDYCLNGSCSDEWSTNLNIDIRYDTTTPPTDIIIAPMSQWNMGRYIKIKDLKSIVKRIPNNYSIGYVGWVTEEYQKELDNLRGISYTNRGDVVDLTNKICSSSTVIGTIGFVTQLAGLTNKKVVWTGVIAPMDRFHPLGDTTYIKNINNYPWEAL